MEKRNADTTVHNTKLSVLINPSQAALTAEKHNTQQGPRKKECLRYLSLLPLLWHCPEDLIYANTAPTTAATIRQCNYKNVQAAHCSNLTTKRCPSAGVYSKQADSATNYAAVL